MRKLVFELVPDGCWGYNLRSILSKSQWDFIKADARSRAGGQCTICGEKTDKLDAHERWSYDCEKGVQKLEDVVAICKDCHSAIHIGRTQLKGDAIRAEDHYMKVNGCSYAEMRRDLGEANAMNAERNKVAEWKLDLSWLKRYAGEE